MFPVGYDSGNLVSVFVVSTAFGTHLFIGKVEMYYFANRIGFSEKFSGSLFGKGQFVGLGQGFFQVSGEYFIREKLRQRRIGGDETNRCVFHIIDRNVFDGFSAYPEIILDFAVFLFQHCRDIASCIDSLFSGFHRPVLAEYPDTFFVRISFLYSIFMNSEYGQQVCAGNADRQADDGDY